MKKRIKKLMVALFALLIATAGMAGTINAASNVIFHGEVPGFEIQPIGNDLFLNFKGMMPGDSREQVVRIENQSSDEVEIFLHAEAISNTDEAFLRIFELRVGAPSGTLFEASPAEITGLAYPVSLGVMRAGEAADAVELTLKLTMPITAGNEFQGGSGIVHWVFSAEERTLPVPTPDPTPEPTTPEPTTPAPTEPSTPAPTEPSTPDPTPEPTTPEPTTPAPTEPSTIAPTQPSTPAPTEPTAPAPEPTPVPRPLIPVPRTGEFIAASIGILLILSAFLLFAYMRLRSKAEHEDH